MSELSEETYPLQVHRSTPEIEFVQNALLHPDDPLVRQQLYDLMDDYKESPDHEIDTINSRLQQLPYSARVDVLSSPPEVIGASLVLYAERMDEINRKFEPRYHEAHRDFCFSVIEACHHDRLPQMAIDILEQKTNAELLGCRRQTPAYSW